MCLMQSSLHGVILYFARFCFKGSLAFKLACTKLMLFKQLVQPSNKAKSSENSFSTSGVYSIYLYSYIFKFYSYLRMESITESQNPQCNQQNTEVLFFHSIVTDIKIQFRFASIPRMLSEMVTRCFMDKGSSPFYISLLQEYHLPLYL